MDASSGAAGWRNTGNTCYLAALMQAMFLTSQFIPLLANAYASSCYLNARVESGDARVAVAFVRLSQRSGASADSRLVQKNQLVLRTPPGEEGGTTYFRGSKQPGCLPECSCKSCVRNCLISELLKNLTLAHLCERPVLSLQGLANAVGPFGTGAQEDAFEVFQWILNTLSSPKQLQLPLSESGGEVGEVLKLRQHLAGVLGPAMAAKLSLFRISLSSKLSCGCCSRTRSIDESCFALMLSVEDPVEPDEAKPAKSDPPSSPGGGVSQVNNGGAQPGATDLEDGEQQLLLLRSSIRLMRTRTQSSHGRRIADICGLEEEIGTPHSSASAIIDGLPQAALFDWSAQPRLTMSSFAEGPPPGWTDQDVVQQPRRARRSGSHEAAHPAAGAGAASCSPHPFPGGSSSLGDQICAANAIGGWDSDYDDDGFSGASSPPGSEIINRSSSRRTRALSRVAATLVVRPRFRSGSESTRRGAAARGGQSPSQRGAPRSRSIAPESPHGPRTARTTTTTNVLLMDPLSSSTGTGSIVTHTNTSEFMPGFRNDQINTDQARTSTAASEFNETSPSATTRESSLTEPSTHSPSSVAPSVRDLTMHAAYCPMRRSALSMQQALPRNASSPDGSAWARLQRDISALSGCTCDTRGRMDMSAPNLQCRGCPIGWPNAAAAGDIGVGADGQELLGDHPVEGAEGQDRSTRSIASTACDVYSDSDLSIRDFFTMRNFIERRRIEESKTESEQVSKEKLDPELAVPLELLLSRFFSSETIPDFVCDESSGGCGISGHTRKLMLPLELPPILVIVFNRFRHAGCSTKICRPVTLERFIAIPQYDVPGPQSETEPLAMTSSPAAFELPADGAGSHGRTRVRRHSDWASSDSLLPSRPKAAAPVDCEPVNLKFALYKLYAVIMHSGKSLHSGHYKVLGTPTRAQFHCSRANDTASELQDHQISDWDPTDEKWWLLDDATVTPVSSTMLSSFSLAQSTTPYVIFFERVGFLSPPGGESGKNRSPGPRTMAFCCDSLGHLKERVLAAFECVEGRPASESSSPGSSLVNAAGSAMLGVASRLSAPARRASATAREPSAAARDSFLIVNKDLPPPPPCRELLPRRIVSGGRAVRLNRRRQRAFRLVTRCTQIGSRFGSCHRWGKLGQRGRRFACGALSQAAAPEVSSGPSRLPSSAPACTTSPGPPQTRCETEVPIMGVEKVSLEIPASFYAGACVDNFLFHLEQKGFTTT